MENQLSQLDNLHPAIRPALPVVAVGGVMLVAIWLCVGFPCFWTGLQYGVWRNRCPATDLRLDVVVDARNVVRGQEGGRLFVSPTARWLTSRRRGAAVQSAELHRGYGLSAQLRGPDGEIVEGVRLGALESDHRTRSASLFVPEVPDDDYVLEVTVDAGFEEAEVALELPLFAPALTHVMTDRPLYKPGQEVLLRAVVFDRRDHSPIGERPGSFRILDPSGQEILLERVRADDWGVAATSLPLDARAPVGTWQAIYTSGDAVDEITFDVRPFQLPRLNVTVSPSQAWFAAGDEVVFSGRAVYQSGAPVGRAPVRLRLAPQEGRWPLPLDWEGELTTRTRADGTFEIDLGPVPDDLMDRTRFSVVAEVTSDSGASVVGRGSLVVSPQSLYVQALTELEDGLVADYNNRAWLRVATPDGRPLRDAAITVRPALDPRAPPIEALTDADGVAAIQIDPGDPVTVVEPAPPARIRPFLPDEPRLVFARAAGPGTALGLEDRRGLDRLTGAIGRCGEYAIGNTEVTVGVQVSSFGTVRRVVGDDGRLAECVQGVMRRARFARGDPRVLQIRWMVPDSREPWLRWEHAVGFGKELVSGAIAEASRGARRCLQRGQGRDGARPLTVQWYVREGSRRVDLSVQRGKNTGLSGYTMYCLASALRSLRLDEAADVTSLGESWATLVIPRPPGEAAPEPTTRTAYELQVQAHGLGTDQVRLGEGTVVVPPGSIPPLRLRATPSLARAGDQVVVDVLRGPQYPGDLPETLRLMEGTVEVLESDVEGNSATFTIPEGVDGFLHVDFAGARTVVFVQRRDTLSVRLDTPQAAVRPGGTLPLTVTTLGGNDPRPAAVGLVGVDQALGQLGPLLGPDAYGRVTVRAKAEAPAFGTSALSPTALALGQISGENAAQAALLGVSELPLDAAGDRATHGSATALADTEQATVDAFYRALEATIAQVRTWEETAAEGELLTPPLMVELYREALAELRKAGAPAHDGFGRELKLPLVPPDLLEQLDPRQVVADATRLPEDVVSFVRYVDEEVAP